MDTVSQKGSPRQNRIAEMYTEQLDRVRSDVVSLVEAVPASLFDFVPAQGAFEHSRSFGEQARHLGTVLRLAAVVLTGEKPPFGPGIANNGPDMVRGREATISFLKESFALARTSIDTLTEDNHLDLVASLFGPVPRASIAVAFVAHSYNHFGQMAVYARLNGIAPPGSYPAEGEGVRS